MTLIELLNNNLKQNRKINVRYEKIINHMNLLLFFF